MKWHFILLLQLYTARCITSRKQPCAKSSTHGDRLEQLDCSEDEMQQEVQKLNVEALGGMPAAKMMRLRVKGVGPVEDLREIDVVDAVEGEVTMDITSTTVIDELKKIVKIDGEDKGKETSKNITGSPLVDELKGFLEQNGAGSKLDGECSLTLGDDGEIIIRCINPNKPCVYQGVEYPGESTIDDYCAQLRCTNGKIEPTGKLGGGCATSDTRDDPHFTTFDGTNFDWHGRCNYTLVQLGTEQDPTYGIFSQFHGCSGYNPKSPSCVGDTVFKDSPNTFVEFKRKDVSQFWVNGERHTTEAGYFDPKSNLMAWKIPRGIRVLGSSKIMIDYKGYMVQMYAPYNQRGQLYGLGGFFDGDKSHDFVSRNGTLTDLTTFANSWKTSSQDSETCDKEDQQEVDLCESKTPTEIKQFETLCIETLKQHEGQVEKERFQVQTADCVKDMCACDSNNTDGCLRTVTSIAMDVVDTVENTLPGCTFQGHGYKQDQIIDDFCAQFRCNEGQLVPTNFVSGVCSKCSVFNDPHFRTFDGTAFDWHVRCNYTLAQNGTEEDPSFGVFTQFVDCYGYNSLPSCVADTTFKVSSETYVSFERRVTDKFWVNGEVQEESFSNDDVIVWRSDSSIWALTDSLMVEFSAHGVYVYAHFSLKNQLNGLCGSFDGDDSNDYVSRSGDQTDLATFANSWKASTQDNADCPLEPQDPVNLCEGKIALDMEMFEDMCKDTLEGRQEKLDWKTYQIHHRACVQDLCACQPTNLTLCLDVVSTLIKNELRTVQLTLPGCTFKGVGYKHDAIVDDHCAQFRCAEGQLVPTGRVSGHCARCDVINDPHFNTFDGSRFNWHARCNFTLVQYGTDQEPDFGVFTQFIDCSSSNSLPSCVSDTTFRVTSDTYIEFRRNDTSQFWINGEPYKTSEGYSENDIKVWQDGRAIRAIGSSQIMVEFTKHSVRVYAPLSQRDKLYGLCGFFDGDKDNDFVDRTNNLTTLAAFANSWKAPTQKSNICSSQDQQEVDLCETKTAEEMIQIRQQVADILQDQLEGVDDATCNFHFQGCVQDMCACTANETSNCLDLCTNLLTDAIQIINDTEPGPVKPCSLQPCFEGVVCTESREAPYFVCGPCPDGFRGDGYECESKGECGPGFAGDGEICGRDSDLDGYPDVDLLCNEPRCQKDNCVSKPNSGQEDVDGDGIGDACDEDAADVDGTVLDGDPDMDDDAWMNEEDNCPTISNPDQDDFDGDNIGDVCDNCPEVANEDQSDSDLDFIGDACDEDPSDMDKDGRQDDRDNCPAITNSDQLDTDGDGKGDQCDDDIDGDDVPNEHDNCPLVSNADQRDVDADGVGDACKGDDDGDGVLNYMDTCPNNPKVSKADFSQFTTVDLDPTTERFEQPDPHWIIRNQGAEILRTMKSNPDLAVGNAAFGGVNFEGTIYVDSTDGDGYAGIVFGYQDNSHFYLVTLKKSDQTYKVEIPFIAEGKSGIQLKLVMSETGPGDMLRNSLWHSESVINQTSVLWSDHYQAGWEDMTAYRWRLLHRPNIGLIRLRLFEGRTLTVDSGNIYSPDLKGGRLGVYSFSQEKITWSQLAIRCTDDVPRIVYKHLPPHLQKLTNIDKSDSSITGF